MQRDAAASRKNFDVYRYIRDEFGSRTADRVYDLTRFNDICLDLGCGAGHIAPHLIKENVGMLMQCDMSRKMVECSKGAPQDEVIILKFIKIKFCKLF